MPDPLGRDKIWNAATWTDIDNAVKAEVGQLRTAQKVFPTTPMPNAASVPADVFDPATMTIAEGQMKPFVELSRDFSLTQAQADNEATLHNGRTLARNAAKTVAQAEDLILFQGQAAALPAGVRAVSVASVGGGLLGIAAHQIDVDTAVKTYPADLIAHVNAGLAHLAAEGQPGPYALFLESTVYADLFRPLGGTITTASDRLTPLLTGGIYSSSALATAAGRRGLLISLGGQPTDIYLGQDATTAYTQSDTNGVNRFRVFERVQFVSRDPNALVRFEFA